MCYWWGYYSREVKNRNPINGRDWNTSSINVLFPFSYTFKLLKCCSNQSLNENRGNFVRKSMKQGKNSPFSVYNLGNTPNEADLSFQGDGSSNLKQKDGWAALPPFYSSSLSPSFSFWPSGLSLLLTLLVFKIGFQKSKERKSILLLCYKHNKAKRMERRLKMSSLSQHFWNVNGNL